MNLRVLSMAFLLIPWIASGEEKRKLTSGANVAINGKLITKATFEALIESQRNYIRLTALNEGEQEWLIAELDANSVNFLTDYQKALADFKMMGGTPRSEYVHDTLRNLIHEKYGGDRTRLDVDLAKSGISQAKFHKMIEEHVIVEVMRARAR